MDAREKMQAKSVISFKQASLKDLCQEDRVKIANLIKELARATEDKEEAFNALEQQRKAVSDNVAMATRGTSVLEKKMEKLQHHNAALYKEHNQLLSKYKESQTLLQQYQNTIASQQEDIHQTLSKLLTPKKVSTPLKKTNMTWRRHKRSKVAPRGDPVGDLASREEPTERQSDDDDDTGNEISSTSSVTVATDSGTAAQRPRKQTTDCGKPSGRFHREEGEVSAGHQRRAAPRKIAAQTTAARPPSTRRKLDDETPPVNKRAGRPGELRSLSLFAARSPAMWLDNVNNLWEKEQGEETMRGGRKRNSGVSRSAVAASAPPRHVATPPTTLLRGRHPPDPPRLLVPLSRHSNVGDAAELEGSIDQVAARCDDADARRELADSRATLREELRRLEATLALRTDALVAAATQDRPSGGRRTDSGDRGRRSSRCPAALETRSETSLGDAETNSGRSAEVGSDRGPPLQTGDLAIRCLASQVAGGVSPVHEQLLQVRGWLQRKLEQKQRILQDRVEQMTSQMQNRRSPVAIDYRDPVGGTLQRLSVREEKASSRSVRDERRKPRDLMGGGRSLNVQDDGRHYGNHPADSVLMSLNIE
ncbi:PREDICTED: uncharacterized protein LOC106809040 [Priapulus caudatus]|uniref:Uncharacterized protein LOC106809040 n=1 Tax=Priapulus caudatus TaxID=37621 RepID=A0ABM1E5J7_PRICU|nr:PREDICTED: uncharacterized protein LOC106809040 [Priapulus caudatus]